jgi:hypothetical protein
MTDSAHQPEGSAQARAAMAAGLIVLASVVLGVAGGFIWAAVAPRVLYQVYTLNPPTAYATDPETSAFIAADGWYCLVAVVGGALIGLLGYLIGVRRYGPWPMVGIVVGATAAAFISRWLGHRQSGGPGFNHVLATSKPGTLLHAPISLGSQGALAFWPLAAAAVAGGIELVGVLRDRRQASYGAVPRPGTDAFGQRPSLESGAGQDAEWARPDATAQPASPPDEHRQPPNPRPGQTAAGPGQTAGGAGQTAGGAGQTAGGAGQTAEGPGQTAEGQGGGGDRRGGDSGRAAL